MNALGGFLGRLTFGGIIDLLPNLLKFIFLPIPHLLLHLLNGLSLGCIIYLLPDYTKFVVFPALQLFLSLFLGCITLLFYLLYKSRLRSGRCQKIANDCRQDGNNHYYNCEKKNQCAYVIHIHLKYDDILAPREISGARKFVDDFLQGL